MLPGAFFHFGMVVPDLPVRPFLPGVVLPHGRAEDALVGMRCRFVMPDLMRLIRVDVAFLFHVLRVTDVVVPSDLAAVAVVGTDCVSHL